MIFLTKDNFDQETLNSSIPVILEFWSEDCRPCFLAEPLLNEIEKCYSGKVKIAKMNVEGNSEKVIEYGITKIPTFIFFKNGQIKNRVEGFYDKYKVEKELLAIL